MKNASQLEEPQRIRCISITNRDQSRKSSPRLNEKVCHCSSGSLCTMSHQTQSPLPLSHTSALPWAKGVQRLYKRTSFINSICIQPFILHPDHPLLAVLINQRHEHLHLRILRPLFAAVVIFLNSLYRPTHDYNHSFSTKS